MPGTWCVTPSARCWSCANLLALRQHRLRHRTRRKDAWPVAVKKHAGLPQKERQECRDERGAAPGVNLQRDRKSTRLNSSHVRISYAVSCLKKKTARWSHSLAAKSSTHCHRV